MKKTKSVTFDEAIVAIKASFLAFPKLWWRIAVVNFLTIGMSFLGMGIAGLLFYLELGGIDPIQSLFLNLQMNPSVGKDLLFSHRGLIDGVFIFVIIWISIFGILGKISSYLTVKNYTKKKTENPFIIYFIKSWEHIWKYGLVLLRAFWYVFWPIIFPILLFFWGVFGGMDISPIYELFELGILGISLLLTLILAGLAEGSIEFSLISLISLWYRFF